MTNYYKDYYNCYYQGSKIKELVRKARKHITIDAGGLIVGVIGLIFML